MVKYKLKTIGFLAAFLLFAQATTLIHAVEHPFHQEDAYCQIYLYSQSLSDETLPSEVQQFLPLHFCLSSERWLDKYLFSINKYQFNIRSPPMLHGCLI